MHAARRTRLTLTGRAGRTLDDAICGGRWYRVAAAYHHGTPFLRTAAVFLFPRCGQRRGRDERTVRVIAAADGTAAAAAMPATISMRCRFVGCPLSSNTSIRIVVS